ncbi:MAG: Rieske 2Fe-2S domain-containing protein [Pseudomonadota bacterium]|nr:Rieske 2Fe-2S domain-containing protein [Pseudomonadota bacterium]
MADLYIGREDEFGERDRKIIAQGDLEIGVFHVDGEFFAYENNCVHQGGACVPGQNHG